jgi:3-phosphoglycerate kinase
MKQKKSLQDIPASELKGKTVFVRADLNCPLNEGVIMDDMRIQKALPTLKYLTESDAKVILASHLGRPKGKETKYSLKYVAEHLGKVIKKPIDISSDCVGPEAKQKAESLNEGDILMLENVRFHPEETSNQEDFSKKLALNADLFVNDAFGAAHRAHASTVGIAKVLPGVAGFLLKKEVDVLSKAFENPDRPFIGIIGGSKVSTKINVLDALLPEVDTLIIGGGMAYTFLKAQGYSIGKSLCEDDKLDTARSFLHHAKNLGKKIILPMDHIVSKDINDTNTTVTQDIDIPENYLAGDIGPKTIALIKDTIDSAHTILWNGPLGIFEFDHFDSGSIEIAHSVASSDAFSIIGGGDTAAAISKAKVKESDISHISTGGGASLEFLEGKPLPGIMALEDRA